MNTTLFYKNTWWIDLWRLKTQHTIWKIKSISSCLNTFPMPNHIHKSLCGHKLYNNRVKWTPAFVCTCPFSMRNCSENNWTCVAKMLPVNYLFSWWLVTPNPEVDCRKTIVVKVDLPVQSTYTGPYNGIAQ